MSVVAIIGAGDVGGALAYRLAARDRIGTIRLIDRAGGVAAGKALDIQQAGPVDGFGTRLTASDDPRAAIGAAVTVIADPVGPGPDDPLALLRDLASSDSRAAFVCALPTQRLLVARGAGELGIPRARLVGSAPAAYASGVRALVAAVLDASPADVSLAVLGCPPEGTVIAWSAATLAGGRLDETASAAQLLRLRQQAHALWPPGPSALASATTRVVEALVMGSHRQFSCFVTLDGEFGVRGRAAALPVELGPGGVRRIVVPSLTVQERVALENALGR